MKTKQHFKRAISTLLAITLLATPALAGMGTVFAGGDTMPPREGEQGFKGKNQPTYHGYSKRDLLDWSPETDEYYDFMIAKVPLQERNEEFRATQANPLLDPKSQVLSLAGDYGNEFFNPTQYNDQFAQNVFNFWQYEDIYASWHGTVNNPTPDTLFNAEHDWWLREYEFGILNIPNPAYTNAAHKNGVKSIGCVFFPRNEHPQDWVYKDENGRFPMADKLVEIAKHYGFDGYFINAEERVPADFMPLYEEFMKAMYDEGLYIQVYASNFYGQQNQSTWGGMNPYIKNGKEFSNWIKRPDGEQASNSLYINPDPSVSDVNGSVEVMEGLGLDPKKTIFNTIEAGQTGFSGRRSSLFNTLDENLVPRTAIASLGNTTCFEHLDETVFGHTGPNKYTENRRGNPDYYKYIAARERTWWSGSLDQPYYTNDSKYVASGITLFDKSTVDYTEQERQELLERIINAETDPYKTANNPDRAKPSPGTDLEGKPFQSWPGMAAYAAERSVINGSNFYTNFNTGHGMQYFVDGKISNDNQWANINIQDILPTWQWWIETPDKATDLIAEEESSSKDEASSEETSSKDEASLEETSSKDEASSQETSSKDEASSEETSSKDEVSSEETSSKDEASSEETSSKDETSSKEVSSKNEVSSEDEIVAEKLAISTSETLNVDFDYGEKYNPAFDLTQVGGYNGGSSLVVKGALNVTNFLRLYKTDLSINENSDLSITYRKPSKTDGTKMQIGLIFKSAPETVKYIDVRDSGTNSKGWETRNIDLSQYAGEELAAFGLAFVPLQGPVDDYQMNIGEIKITDGSVKQPDAPKGLEIDKAFDTSEMYISWDLDEYDEVQKYNVYAEYEDGREVYLGGSYDDVYYIKSLYDPKGNVKIKLTAVGKDGAESEAAVVERDFSKTVENISVKQDDGLLKAAKNVGLLETSWKNPNVNYASIKMDVTFNYGHKLQYTQNFKKGTDSANFEVPIADGSSYTLRISLLDGSGNVISYTDTTGQIKDTYSEPYVGEATLSGRSIKLSPPLSKDWWHIYVTQNGNSIINKDGKNFLYRGQDISGLGVTGTSGKVEVILEDFAGNFSKPVEINFGTGGTVIPGEVDASMFPDPVLLEKVKEVAPTTEKLKNITSLNLSNSDVKDLTGIALLTKLEVLNLSNCTKLDYIYDKQLAGNSSLKEINLTGCSSLKVANLNYSKLEKVICNDVTKLSNLISLNMSNSQFDMSEGTPERAFADAVAKQAEGKDDIVGKDANLSKPCCRANSTIRNNNARC